MQIFELICNWIAKCFKVGKAVLGSENTSHYVLRFEEKVFLFIFFFLSKGLTFFFINRVIWTRDCQRSSILLESHFFRLPKKFFPGDDDGAQMACHQDPYRPLITWNQSHKPSIFVVRKVFLRIRRLNDDFENLD